MDVMVVAGEASGDAHAADLVAALRRARPGLRFFGMGGEKMAAADVELIHSSSELSVMGIVEVLPKLPRLFAVKRNLVRAAAARKPSVAILVDVPDFNLRLAKDLKRLGVQVAYYVSPMVWAWRPGRVEVIRRRVDRMLCILPFEERFYRDRGLEARYVGNPTVEQLPARAPAPELRRRLGLEERRTLALLPGSRRSELSRILPTLLEVAAGAGDVQLVMPVAPGLPRAELEQAVAAKGVRCTFFSGRAPEVVGASDAAVVASGTATLETALMGCPMVCVYRVSPLTFAIGRRLVKVPHVCLVNLLAGRGVVPELLQDDFTAPKVLEALAPLWAGEARERMLRGFDEVRAVLGPAGAAQRAAQAVLELLPQG
ncbi:MAG: lipid-A-disaccharide synthase [Myxococcaceae bacterium]|nr:lipid-A-disaccharide synthase [Myxococcaceae bacterium]